MIGDRLVLYREPDGAVAVLEDRCAHRSMPLSLGRIADGGRLVCPYHGLAYDGTGACVQVPGQDEPGRIRIRAYPVEERAGVVFVWMGRPGGPTSRCCPIAAGWRGRGGTGPISIAAPGRTICCSTTTSPICFTSPSCISRPAAATRTWAMPR